jgi:hypothetical protein
VRSALVSSRREYVEQGSGLRRGVGRIWGPVVDSGSGSGTACISISKQSKVPDGTPNGVRVVVSRYIHNPRSGRNGVRSRVRLEK